MTTKVVNLRKEPYDIYIGRPSIWGNPFKIGRDGNREDVLEKFLSYLMERPILISRIKNELKGKTLGCYCKPLPCHGDVLAQIADSN